MTDLVDESVRDVIGKTPREVNLELATNMYDAITASVTIGQTQRTSTITAFDQAVKRM